ncbi:hypothetical protein C8F01DRAFT_634212 [Mycena amicta]|nr:hypothetical protein C8F01DRAFT_634212 [Mycena amicta]
MATCVIRYRTWNRIDGTATGLTERFMVRAVRAETSPCTRLSMPKYGASRLRPHPANTYSMTLLHDRYHGRTLLAGPTPRHPWLIQLSLHDVRSPYLRLAQDLRAGPGLSFLSDSPHPCCPPSGRLKTTPNRHSTSALPTTMHHLRHSLRLPPTGDSTFSIASSLRIRRCHVTKPLANPDARRHAPRFRRRRLSMAPKLPRAAVYTPVVHPSPSPKPHTISIHPCSSFLRVLHLFCPAVHPQHLQRPLTIPPSSTHSARPRLAVWFACIDRPPVSTLYPSRITTSARLTVRLRWVAEVVEGMSDYGIVKLDVSPRSDDDLHPTTLFPAPASTTLGARALPPRLTVRSYLQPLCGRLARSRNPGVDGSCWSEEGQPSERLYRHLHRSALTVTSSPLASSSIHSSHSLRRCPSSTLHAALSFVRHRKEASPRAGSGDGRIFDAYLSSF